MEILIKIIMKIIMILIIFTIFFNVIFENDNVKNNKIIDFLSDFTDIRD